MAVACEEAVSFPNLRGEILSGILHHPPGAAGEGAVIVCHGMESNKESEKLVFLSRALAQKGIAALRFDFACAGNSGRFEEITYSDEVEDLQGAYLFVRKRTAGKIAILGSSMGGTVALLFAAQEPSVAALVTVASPLHPERFPDRLLTEDQIREWHECGYTFYHGQRINVALLHELQTINVPAAVRNISCPVLIIHGEADDTVPVDEAYELNSSLMHDKKLVILPGGDHRFSDPAVMQQALSAAISWISEYVG